MIHSMQAAIITGPGQAGLTEIPIPDPGSGDLLIRVEGCGVCPSNLPLWQGRPWFTYPAPPGNPGHEGWGTVEATGHGVKGFAEGDRVTFLSSQAYAEYDLVPAEAAVKLPSSLDGKAFPGEPVGCAVNVFRRSQIRADQTVAVIGAGFLGIIFTALAAAQGANVVAITRRRASLDLAKKYGAAESVTLDDHQGIIDRLNKITGGKGCDRVIEATGHQWPLDLAGELVGERGTLVIAGYHQDGPRQVNLQQWNWKGIDVINAHERDRKVYLEGIREGIRAAESGLFRLDDLVTHDFSLRELDKAYAAITERPEGFIKGIIRM
ncbi:zinc-dependent alcohol dehydrogenase [Geotalea daltonii FRC-32]|uniref:Zinc-dependent alcohol dehydrogenase n=1 Tax=Geotalea daltonii (strain DSM 22248 / JCM 15807 / FRC-32) TaxID=316067 RepID=B9M4D0_GEODF|nr:Zn-dependent alcohol dehydrogenase [Geotalea daltonii]ACM21585.1 zinc-dependent alcohol dehydrogenase [Geotalea daltonii FRC-32]